MIYEGGSGHGTSKTFIRIRLVGAEELRCSTIFCAINSVLWHQICFLHVLPACIIEQCAPPSTEALPVSPQRSAYFEHAKTCQALFTSFLSKLEFDSVTIDNLKLEERRS